VPTSSWLLVLVLGGRHVGLGSVDRARPPLDVGKLMAKNDYGLVWHLGAAERAVVAFLLGHWANLATTSPAFHRVWKIPILVQWQGLGG
jgi:hypothetical protein